MNSETKFLDPGAAGAAEIEMQQVTPGEFLLSPELSWPYFSA